MIENVILRQIKWKNGVTHTESFNIFRSTVIGTKLELLEQDGIVDIVVFQQDGAPLHSVIM